MIKGLRRHLTFANVMSSIAVFVALGGGAYALSLGKGAVKTRNIRNGAVKTAKLGNGAVKTGKIANNAVSNPKVRDLVYTALDPSTGDCQAPTAAYQAPEAAIDAQGVVHLRGAVYNCTGGNMLVLPSQFRPSKALEFTAFSGGSAAFAGSVVIDPSGLVSNSSGTNGGIHHIDGITYSP
jgi:hypothetical protein